MEDARLPNWSVFLLTSCTARAMEGNLVAKSYLYFKASDVRRLEWTFC